MRIVRVVILFRMKNVMIYRSVVSGFISCFFWF